MLVHETVVAASARTGWRSSSGCASAAIEPYPVGFDRDHTAARVRERFGELAPDAQTGRAGARRRAR